VIELEGYPSGRKDHRILESRLREFGHVVKNTRSSNKKSKLDGILILRQRESEKNYRRNSEERFRSQ